MGATRLLTAVCLLVFALDQELCVRQQFYLPLLIFYRRITCVPFVQPGLHGKAVSHDLPTEPAEPVASC